MSEASIKAGTANLIPFRKGDMASVKAAIKGGLVKSQAKSDEGRWKSLKAHMKRKAMTDEQFKWMVERLESRDNISADILVYLDEIKRDVHPAQRIALANAVKDVAKFQHGEKIKTENVNINVNCSMEEWENRLSTLLDDDVAEEEK